MEPDKDLIKRVSEKDRKAQTQLYKMCFSILMSIAMRYKNNEGDAVELVNNAFMKIVLNVHKKKPEVPFIPWIRRIMINETIDDYRKNKKREDLFSSNGDVENRVVTTHNEVVEVIEEDELNDMLFSLPNATRNVFNLFAIDGYSHKEIAEMLEISVETSKWHVKQARKNLKELIKTKELI